VEVEIDETEELLVRGATVAPGQAEADGWLRTGDLARRDADGDLWITGRMSDRIISGGVNVDPVVVERALEGHPEVVEAAVTGIPDKEWGERVVAAVVTSSSKDRLREELAELARSALAPAQRPRDIRFLPTLPRNPNGKVDRKGIQDLFR
jgi:fatty-acyl-CoA synthase